MSFFKTLRNYFDAFVPDYKEFMDLVKPEFLNECVRERVKKVISSPTNKLDEVVSLRRVTLNFFFSINFIGSFANIAIAMNGAGF